ncbi:copper transporter [Thalassotalea insulae]|uniref:Copper transporter n=1 Tax=Thalassotalea insulae TaxID=2056778 RepID=A0ABQ6GWR5_9GAMM|nr:efflux RND transporter periplasmic adaptor subunit [Thalassotalea insulae]GLX80388.1 copper transporter [Thalassotalea insulae]
MLSHFKIITALLLGIIIGAIAIKAFQSITVENPEGKFEKKPLYWVAPMDSNYRRDKPGKSPMGMDLIPVYQDGTDTTTQANAIKINPTVINNLGVRTATVTDKVMTQQITTVGYVKYDEDKLVHIHPRVDGWIEQLYVKAVGDPVTKGQALYTLYSPELVNAQEEFLIALSRGNNALISAARSRLTALQLSKKFITELEKSQQVQQFITFYAPQSGVVDGLQIRAGSYVKPGTTLMAIGQLDQVWVEAEIFERDAELVKTDAPVTMSLDYLSGRKWRGIVDYIYPTLDEKNRTLRVRLKFNNEDLQLKPNMFAQITIFSPQPSSSLVVPKEAVIRTGSQNRVVLALADGYFKSIAVTIGRVDERYIEIIQGVKAGDRIVTSAQFLIDSESSKNSDFKRMTTVEPDVQRATVSGVINHIDINNRLINISREPIEKWHRPAATLDFVLAEQLAIEQLSPEMTVNFTFEVRDELVIVDITQVTTSHVDH